MFRRSALRRRSRGRLPCPVASDRTFVIPVPPSLRAAIAQTAPTVRASMSAMAWLSAELLTPSPGRRDGSCGASRPPGRTAGRAGWTAGWSRLLLAAAEPAAVTERDSVRKAGGRRRIDAAAISADLGGRGPKPRPHVGERGEDHQRHDGQRHRHGDRDLEQHRLVQGDRVQPARLQHRLDGKA